MSFKSPCWNRLPLTTRSSKSVSIVPLGRTKVNGLQQRLLLFSPYCSAPIVGKQNQFALGINSTYGLKSHSKTQLYCLSFPASVGHCEMLIWWYYLYMFLFVLFSVSSHFILYDWESHTGIQRNRIHLTLVSLPSYSHIPIHQHVPLLTYFFLLHLEASPKGPSAMP